MERHLLDRQSEALSSMLELYGRRAHTHFVGRRVDMGGPVGGKHDPGTAGESIGGIVRRGNALANEPLAVALGARLDTSAVPVESLRRTRLTLLFGEPINSTLWSSFARVQFASERQSHYARARALPRVSRSAKSG